MSKLKVKHKDNQIIINSKLVKGEEINQQEIDVMRSKIIRGLMKPALHGMKKIVYIAPNGITLKSYLASGITINDFYLVFAQVIEAVKSVNRNSFNINNLILNLNYSFINERTKEIHFIYQPIHTQAISSNLAYFLYDIAYGVDLALGEDYKDINRIIDFMKSLQEFSVEKLENYIIKVYPQVYKQVKRQKPGQSQMLRGDDFYYRQNEFSGRKDAYSTDLLSERFDEDTALLIEDDDATALLIEDENATSLLSDDATSILDAQTENYPYLIRISTFDRIDINKPVFRIGKERSSADYSVQNNNAVSRLHANIITKGNQYFIIDNNSTNRTFINGSDIQPEQEFEIIDGDEITLANEKFEFHLN